MIGPMQARPPIHEGNMTMHPFEQDALEALKTLSQRQGIVLLPPGAGQENIKYPQIVGRFRRHREELISQDAMPQPSFAAGEWPPLVMEDAHYREGWPYPDPLTREQWLAEYEHSFEPAAQEEGEPCRNKPQ